MKPGIHPRIPIQQYHDLNGWSHSQLMTAINGSWYKFWSEYIVPRETPDLTVWGNTSRPMCIGGAAAAWADSREVFEANYVVMNHKVSAKNKNSSEFKEEFRRLTLENTSRTVVLQQEFNLACDINDALREHPDPLVREQLNQFLDDEWLASEASYWDTDPESGLLIKARPDWTLPSLLGDMKTSASCAPRDVSKRCFELGWDVQAAMAIDIYNRLTNSKVENWLLVVVEQSEPFDCGVYFLRPSAIEQGRRRYKQALVQLAECLESDRWPGKVGGIQPLDLPDWYYKNLEWSES